MTFVTKLAEAAAEELLERLCWRAAPPVDVTMLAYESGVREVTFRSDIFGDGRLETHPAGHVIVVQARSNRARQRFTVAHELGHLWLRKYGADVHHKLDRATEERFCDAFAAALLLPGWWVDKEGAPARPSLPVLRSMADEAEVSLASCLIRLGRFPRWRRSLLRLRYHETQWRLFSATGLPRPLRDCVRTTDETRRVLGIVARLPDKYAECPISIGIGEDEHHVRAEVSVMGDGALVLVDLRSYVRSVSAGERPCGASPGDLYFKPSKERPFGPNGQALIGLSESYMRNGPPSEASDGSPAG